MKILEQKANLHYIFEVCTEEIILEIFFFSSFFCEYALFFQDYSFYLCMCLPCTLNPERSENKLNHVCEGSLSLSTEMKNRLTVNEGIVV